MKLSETYTENLGRLVGSDEFMKVADDIMGVETENKTYFGSSLLKMQKQYRLCGWFVFFVFKLGYAQALSDTGQNIRILERVAQ